MMQPTSNSSSYAQSTADNHSVHSAQSHPLTEETDAEELFLDEPENATRLKISSKVPQNTASTASTSSTTKPQDPPSSFLSRADLQTFRALDAEYERALEEREVAYAARYNSVRQSACFAVTFMAIYMTLGTLYFMRQANWTLEESLFFGIYTITTVGYGNLDNPETPAFQLYTIFFILIGIATLTIMVAQVYQCIALEAGRAQHSRDSSEMIRRGLLSSHQQLNNPRESRLLRRALRSSPFSMEQCLYAWERTRAFLSQNEVGKAISVLLPFVGLILLGATVVGVLEGWTPIESVYFAVVSLTTVGLGDYFPTNSASRLFCILWLPFSVGFMSLYLGNIAAFYIRLSDRNIARIERHLRRRINALKQLSEREREAARARALRGQGNGPEGATDDNENSNSNNIQPNENDTGAPRAPKISSRSSSFSTTGEGVATSGGRRSAYRRSAQLGKERRKRVLQNHLQRQQQQQSSSTDTSPGTNGDDPNSAVPTSGMATMQHVLQAVHENITEKGDFKSGPEAEYLSFRTNRGGLHKHALQKGSVRKPSFALRVLVQERFAQIIAQDVAGYQSRVDMSDAALTVTIDSLKATTEKWLIPRKARRAFRAVAFEALYFVGEHDLIVQGASALFALNPFEFHALFAPLLAAMGDAEAMEGWLASTEILSANDQDDEDDHEGEDHDLDNFPRPMSPHDDEDDDDHDDDDDDGPGGII